MMNGTTIYRPGSVVLAPFPFTNLSAIKARPVLVVSSREFNRRQEDVIVVAITSNPYADRTQYAYPLTESECKRAGLFFPSIVKTGKIFTLDQRLIRKPLGVLPGRSTKDIIRKTTAAFG